MVPRMIRVVTQPLRSSLQQKPLRLPPRRPSPAPRYIAGAVHPARHLPPSTRLHGGLSPSRGPGNANLFFSARLGFIWCRLSSRRSRALPPLRGRLLFPPIVPPPAPWPLPPCPLSFLRRPFVRGIPLLLPASLYHRPSLSLGVSLFRSVPQGRPPSSSSSSAFPPRAHLLHLLASSSSSSSSPSSSSRRSATPPPPSRPIQSPPRHPSFTASVAAHRLSFCHCGLFDILSTAVRAEARLSRGRREILETNDGGRKKSRTWEPILAPASRGF